MYELKTEIWVSNDSWSSLMVKESWYSEVSSWKDHSEEREKLVMLLEEYHGNECNWFNWRKHNMEMFRILFKETFAKSVILLRLNTVMIGQWKTCSCWDRGLPM